jgi:hypothetical protein
VVAEGAPWKVMSDKAAMERAHLEPTDSFRLFSAAGRAFADAVPPGRKPSQFRHVGDVLRGHHA